MIKKDTLLKFLFQNVYDYIAKGKYDTVIVNYASIMIGAHENPSSSNYKVFSFSE